MLKTLMKYKILMLINNGDDDDSDDNNDDDEDEKKKNKIADLYTVSTLKILQIF